MAPRHLSQEAIELRESDILDQAAKIVQSECIGFFTMDKLINQVNYSKGTVYNHFSCKEDLFTGMCNRHMLRLIRLFTAAQNIDTSARYKMLALSFSYMLSILQNPESFFLMMTTSTENFEKASQARTAEHERLNDAIRQICCNIVQEAVDKKEVCLTSAYDVEDISISAYAMTFGSIGLFLKKDSFNSSKGGSFLEDKMIFHINTMMNGFNWKEPEQNQDEFIAMIKQTIYAKELEVLQDKGINLATLEMV